MQLQPLLTQKVATPPIPPSSSPSPPIISSQYFTSCSTVYKIWHELATTLVGYNSVKSRQLFRSITDDSAMFGDQMRHHTLTGRDNSRIVIFFYFFITSTGVWILIYCMIALMSRASYMRNLSPISPFIFAFRDKCDHEHTL
jgi:hypothetical protein